MSLLPPSPVKGFDALPPMPHRRWRGSLVVGAVILVLLVIVAGFLGQRVLSAGQGNQATSFPSSNGPYVRMPLTAQQINNLEHLSEHMKYKALASLYVDHMSLDDKLGQLIMLEFNETSYSDNLDYAINTLHVGGVIMYDIQINTFNQTKGDIAHMQARSQVPLMISVDQEGGIVNRLHKIYGDAMSATDIEATGST
ncbi:MAG TPA: glycoside hydrolase family 3 N-terminal domain-containing protein, partial [Ktedonobacteraceae bacterium]|nr:glycoside hydrolase family 3 N-terminal domain-containing protein [Ktedonobacteraceae bacterium]